jgi:pimeloyl-ACP methyl ester carboxylesterase
VAQITQRSIQSNGIQMHVAEAGDGPAVLLCHGFPESWYSWRHQLTALANAGYRAIAPHMRGYGLTDKPDAIDQYTLLHLTGDMVGVLDALEIKQAAIVGHDWGAPVAWYSALFRPDRFPAVAGLSVPFRPRSPVRPSTVMPRTDDAVFYQLYFQDPGVAEAALEKDVRSSIRGVLYALSGDAKPEERQGLGMVSRTAPGALGHTLAPAALPKWLTEADIDVYAAEFQKSGFRGGLNWYRNIDRSWELLAPWAGARIDVPALYVAGDRDLVLAFRGMDQLLPNLRQIVPKLEDVIILPGCGHWTQQERPEAVNAALLSFLKKHHR